MRTLTTAARFGACAVMVLATACGGSGGGGGDGSGGGGGDTTQEFGSVAAVDGFITYPDPSLLLPAVPETGKGVVVGDTYLEEQTDGFLRFGHPAIPSGSTIVSATMVVYQELVVGTPFADLGGFVAADHVFIGAYLGDPSAAMIQAAFGVVSTDAGVGPRTLDVTAQVQLDVDANRATSDFVLRFPAWTDVDSSTDAVLFTDAENFYGSGTPPTLLVTWR